MDSMGGYIRQYLLLVAVRVRTGLAVRAEQVVVVAADLAGRVRILSLQHALGAFVSMPRRGVRVGGWGLELAVAPLRTNIRIYNMHTYLLFGDKTCVVIRHTFLEYILGLLVHAPVAVLVVPRVRVG